jgi:hypothetical protein
MSHERGRHPAAGGKEPDYGGGSRRAPDTQAQSSSASSAGARGATQGTLGTYILAS